MKILLKGLTVVAAFFGVWLLLAQLDFVTFFKIDKVRNATEISVGDLIWDEISKSEDVVYNDSIVKELDKLIAPICAKNGMERDSLKVHIVKKDEVNAFALPNNHLVVYTGLILKCQKQEALQGVLGHEIAHIENNHVMKKLSKEIGLSVLLSATAGGKGGAILKEIARKLTSSAYDRSLEKEADMASVEYLLNADINPEPLADFMYELAQNNELAQSLYWISTHPESEERAKYILEHLKGKKFKKKATLSDKDWEGYKKLIRDNLN